MSESVILPALGESVTEGTVTRWLKNVGDTIEVDEPLLEVSTDKVDTEVPSPIAGVLEEILVQEDETAEVGAVLARVGDGSGSNGEAPAAEPAESTSGATKDPEEDASERPADDAANEPTATESASGDGQAVKLPSLGESITEGTVTRWLKSVGDSVEVDEPLLEVSTDKVDTEVPSPIAGIVQEILVQEDETVQVGGDLVIVGSGSVAESATEAEPAAESKPEPEPEPKRAAESKPEPAAKLESKPESKPEPKAEPAADASSAGQSGYLTPIVRKLANDLGVDLSRVGGTGVGGRIRKEDVLAAHRTSPKVEGAASAAPSAPAAKPEVSELRGTTAKMSRLRKVIAERAVASLQQSAQLTTVVEVDVTRVARLRDAKKAEFLDKTGNKLSFMPFFAIAAAEALRTYPIINSTVEGDSVVYPETENISIAVDTERGLLTPVVRDAGDKNIAELAADIADLAARTRDNQLKPDELAGGTFTLTNTGSRGALFDTPLVFLPQSAILGTGAVVKKPAVVSTPEGDAIAVRQTVYLALSYDHRTIDGADAARFLSQMKQRLEEGAFEADLGV